jgi:predicted nucleotidyltransferase
MINLYRAVRILAAAGVEFVIVGGLALRSHGSAYLTQDLDVCYRRTNENLKLIAEALAPIHPRPRGFPEELPFVWDWTTLQHGTDFTFVTELGDIDLLGEVSGVGDYDAVLRESIIVDLEGSEVRILSVEGLIKAKEAAGRTKDLAGLQELYAIRESRLTESEEPNE